MGMSFVYAVEINDSVPSYSVNMFSFGLVHRFLNQNLDFLTCF